MRRQLVGLATGLYGNGMIETWVHMMGGVFFDVVIIMPNAAAAFSNDWLVSLETMRQQTPMISSQVRAWKYWCKRLDAPIKSYAIEHIMLHLLKSEGEGKGPSKACFVEFLRVLTRGNWPQIVGLVEEDQQMDDTGLLEKIARNALTTLGLSM
ncbi:MAG: hypothetical protein EOP04_17495 [Proteobacteria bacterium]|nr:MAG: hypothetical protein EOP04_17495 [Pseudomonadota bacterium]